MDFLYVKRDLLDQDLEPEICGPGFEAAWQDRLRLAARRALTVEGVNDRVPFVLQADGSLDEELSTLFRLWAGQVPGRTTMESYGRHAFRLLKTMHSQGIDLRSVTVNYLANYRRIREATEIQRKPVDDGSRRTRKPISWNSEASALKSFFDAVVLAEIRSDNPCDHKALKWYNAGASVTPEEPDFITLAEFEHFRDEGLAFGRYGLRNVAFANMLLTSGMRLDEGNDYTMARLPSLDVVQRAKGNSIRHRVAAEAAKGYRARSVRISKNAYHSMRTYSDILRDDMIARALAKGRITNSPDAFWLNQSADPIGEIGWGDVFRRASERTGIKVTPKTLRHTCAVYLLSRLLKAMLSSVADARAEAQQLRSRSQTQILHSIFGDPLRRVQKYLGHKHYETTFIYLDVLGSHDQITDDALAVFDQVISAEEAFDVAF